MFNPTRPVLHQGFMIHRSSSGSSIVKVDIGAPRVAMTAFLQGFQLDNGDVYVPLSGYYLFHMDVTYFFRGHIDGSQVNVYVTCTRSDSKEVLVKITQWCRIGRYCSVTFHGISFLSQGHIVYCEASHANDMITAIENTHISLALY
ncbi:uncharacterized protein LOC124272005 [Haliotis rubra]|uniref:uncharacterized protein LOC124272005 n=1 Tax=Haliotis rubra TaxID=36100 RepID=UPI001EE57991|nr:uncharacterized protein LOC124272005 [Haliotis rubra]